MTDTVMFSETLQRVVTLKRVRVIDRPLPRSLPDNSHQIIFADVLHNACIHLSIALQQAKRCFYLLRLSCASPSVCHRSMLRRVRSLPSVFCPPTPQHDRSLHGGDGTLLLPIDSQGQDHVQDYRLVAVHRLLFFYVIFLMGAFSDGKYFKKKNPPCMIW